MSLMLDPPRKKPAATCLPGIRLRDSGYIACSASGRAGPSNLIDARSLLANVKAGHAVKVHAQARIALVVGMEWGLLHLGKSKRKQEEGQEQPPHRHAHRIRQGSAADTQTKFFAEPKIEFNLKPNIPLSFCWQFLLSIPTTIFFWRQTYRDKCSAFKHFERTPHAHANKCKLCRIVPKW
jgi:hypothetical protein